MRKRVLLISVPFMSLYKDIIEELTKQGYDVTYLPDCHFPDNHFDVHEHIPNKRQISAQSKKNRKYWETQICKNNIDYCFDYMLVVDGFSLVNSGFIEYLESKNPDIRKILYLFDRTYENYRFDLMFKSFDKIFSFDLLDCQQYGINLLPIYWVPTADVKKAIDVFGFGTYMPNRYILFDYVDKLTRDTQLQTYIKLYIKEYPNTVKFKIRKLIKGGWFPDDVYNSHLITHETIPPTEFRRLLSGSRIVLDTHDVVQDGLTARFMWALGADAKIITTNDAVRNYPFYDENRIAIFDVEHPYISKAFLTSEYKVDEKKRKIIDQYRIDNWIKTLLFK